MTSVSDNPYAPAMSPETAFFWDGLREGRLLLPFCRNCERYSFPPMPACPHCQGDVAQMEPREASGRGTVYSWIVAYYAFDEAFAADVPYTILTVDLAEGPRIYGRFEGPHDDVVPGLPVQATFLDRGSYTVLGFQADAA